MSEPLSPLRRGLILLAVIALIAVLPHILTTSYWRGVLVIMAMNVMIALALNLVLGYTGQLHLGQAGFVALGAYVSTILIKTHGWNFWAAGLAATLAAGLLGLALAAFAVRLRGHYLGIASLGFAIIVHQSIANWEDVTEGMRGIYGIAPPPPIPLPGLGEISFAGPVNLFYLVAGVAVLVYLLLAALLRSPAGEALAAVREDEISAASLGIDSRVWKAFAFALGSAIAGLAGCFYPVYVGTLVPDAFTIVESFTMMAMVIVGGMGTMAGPVLGAVVLTALPELLREFGQLRLITYGAALTLVVLFMPGGMMQGWQLLAARWRRQPPARQTAGAPRLAGGTEKAR
ncbi:MAG: branched-chain amino acid ABC transporter permease [Alcaligenaceae bacterium]|nr:branched-chain amino acid ABC transporter permease [Alcaligenaceae bacterium SAGV5]MPS53159.1 branched-chain amino acid ABC transporter permease [Alcaligenaceae bacterium SAGV3]MPT55403.1 branched-chain amino acid ABC transporter permease [Alcaligenaceae bacterium]